MFTVSPGLYGLIPGWANLTGVLLLIILFVILATSQECVRRGGFFNTFYFCHLLYWPFFILLILHAPNFTYFAVVPGFCIINHILHRIFYGHTKTIVKKATLLPPDCFCIEIKKPANWNFGIGDWISVNIPSIAAHEWHAFTISSSPDLKDYFTLHIRAVGPWTKRLRSVIFSDFAKKSLWLKLKNRDKESLRSERHSAHLTMKMSYDSSSPDEEIKPLTVYIDGPFHAPASNIFNTEHAVLMSTGIGVTPMASVLQTIFHRYQNATKVCPTCYTSLADLKDCGLGKLKKVEFHWIVSQHVESSWFLELLADIEIAQQKIRGPLDKFLDIYIYITRATSKTDMCAISLRMAMNLFYKKKQRDLLTGLQSRTIAGRPRLTKLFRRLREENKANSVEVYFCGNTAVGDILHQTCKQFGIPYHREIF